MKEKNGIENTNIFRVLLGAGFVLAFFVLTQYFSTYYALAYIAAVVVLFLFARRYLWALMILALPSLAIGQVIYFAIRPNWIYEMTIAEVIILLVAGAYILEKIFLPTKPARIERLSIALGLYALIGLLSFWQVEDLELYIAGLKVVIFSLLSYFLAKELIDDEAKKFWFLAGLTLTAVILSAEIFYTIYQTGFTSKIFFERSLITTPIGAIALVSALIVFLLPIPVGFYFSLPSGHKAKPFILAAFGLGWVAVFITLGKAAIFSLLIGMLYLFIKFRTKRVIFFLVFATFAIAGILFMTPFFTGLFERLANAFVDINSKFRVEEYKTAFKIIKDHWLTGVGSGQQLLYYQKMLNPYHRELVNNFFLQGFIDYGIIGLGLIFLILSGVIKNVRKTFTSDSREIVLRTGFIAALLVAFFNGLFEVTFFALPYAIVFWMTVGVFSQNKK